MFTGIWIKGLPNLRGEQILLGSWWNSRRTLDWDLSSFVLSETTQELVTSIAWFSWRSMERWLLRLLRTSFFRGLLTSRILLLVILSNWSCWIQRLGWVGTRVSLSNTLTTSF